MRTPTRFSAGVTDPDRTPFERFEQFARKIVLVPKEEADKVRVRAETRKKIRDILLSVCTIESGAGTVVNC